MPRKTLSMFGLRASVFADRSELGLEFSARRPRRAAEVAHEDVQPPPAPPVPRSDSEEAKALAARVAALTWYHTIELPHGIVTPGYYDHRDLLPRYRLPERLDGLRVLDVATFDGFWAFEFERRGAAEVVALDVREKREIDLPPRTRAAMTEAELSFAFGRGFALSREALGSRVEPLHCNVYDLSPERAGLFDLVHVGDLLLHLRDPVRALTAIRSVCRGRAIISDVIFPDLDRGTGGVPLMQYQGGRGQNVWWRLGAEALRAMVEDAGFENVEEVSRFKYGQRGLPPAIWHAVFSAGV
jgi:tRNA (mo5U34)-methyltransferase